MLRWTAATAKARVEEPFGDLVAKRRSAEIMQSKVDESKDDKPRACRVRRADGAGRGGGIRRRFSRFTWLLLVLGCVQALSAAEVWVLRDDLTGVANEAGRKWVGAFAAANIAARETGSEELAARLAATPGPGAILVMTRATDFPAEALLALQAFLRRGNHLVAVSGPPFSRLKHRRDGHWAEADGAVAAPVLEAISPSYKLHRVQASALANLGEPAPREFSGTVLAPLPRSSGFGSESLRKWRQIPLAYALDAAGAKRGIAAELLLNNDGEYAGSVWGYLGLLPADVERNAAWSTSLVVAMVRRIQGGLFLANAGASRFAVASGERLTLGAYVANLTGHPAEWEVSFTVAANGRVVHASASVPSHGGGEARITPVAGETLTLPAGVYEVTTTLARGGVTIDTIRQPVRVVEFGPVASEEIVGVKDGDFVLAGRPWHPFGINYWPCYVLGLEESDFSNAQWDPALYDPEGVEAELAAAEGMGLSMVSIQYNRLEQAGPVMDLLARAERHHLKVHAFLPGLDPLQPDFPRASALIRAAHLAESPAFFAYDLGWEVRVGVRTARVAWDRAWHRWVLDRYGSVELAEQDWGFSPAREGGILTGASDEQLKQDGPWRIYVAAYRRFLDDTISRRYREVRDFVRSLDAHHLLGARSGFGGTGAEWIAEYLPFDLASGAKHLDFICPEHYEDPHTRQEFLKGAFTTAYARLVSGGKPVYWAEFGRPVAWKVEAAAYEMEPAPATLRSQADYFRDVIGMVRDGGANGCAGWWWPAGYRVDEKSDFGLVRPDLTLRPAGEEVVRAAKEFRGPREAVPTAGETVVDRDRYVTGYAGLYVAHSAAYAEALMAGRVPRLRTEGSGTDSVTTPLVAVGNRPATGRNPPKFLNAEFNFLRLNGRAVCDGDVVTVAAGRPVEVEASVGNTAEAAWRAQPGGTVGAVQLMARWEGGEASGAIERDVPYLADARVPAFRIAPRLDKAEVISFRMTAHGRTDFGEVIRVTLQPAVPGTPAATP